MTEWPKTEIEIEMDVEEEFCAVMERIKSEDTKSFSTKLGTFLEDYRVQRLDNSSELCTEIPQLTKDIHPSLRCRLCATPDKDMADIFNSNATGKNILEMINYCLPVMVKEGDTLPRRICSFCSEELKRCYRFHETVEKVEKQLLALVKVTSIKLEETEGDDESFQLYDTQRGLTDNNNIDVSFQSTSVVEMCNSEESSITEEAQTADTTVNRNAVLASLRPCSVVLSCIEVYRENSFDAENEGKSSSDLKLQNPDPTTEAIDSQTTTALEGIRESTCDSEVTRADYSTSVADEEDILTLRSGKKVDHKTDLVVRGQVDTVYQRYECILCSKVFTSHRSLNQHNKLHTNEGLHACKYCGKKFTSKGERDRHCVSHTGERPFECTICKKTFRLASTLRDHKTVHSNERNYACSMCDKSFKSNSARKLHMLVHSNQRPWECNDCKKKFKSKPVLKRHIEAHHSPHIGKGFTCKYCEKKFTTNHSLKRHHLTHTGERPFQCSICRMTFRLADTLRDHKTVHSNERNYACSMCDKSFKLWRHRKKHMLVHSNERPWECDDCKKKFKRKRALQLHIARKHSLHGGEGLNTCEYCDKKFVRKADLDHHHRTHTRPFQCPICQKRFTESDRLERHDKRVHIDKRPWECDYCKNKYKAKFDLQRHIEGNHTLHLGVGFSCKYCEKEFTRKDSLNLHHLTHTGERPFECTICRKTFRLASTLRDHKTVHSNERNYACSVCDKSFKSHRNRKKHMLVHSNERPWECGHCKINFKCKDTLQFHIARKHSLHGGEGLSTCEYCDKKFVRKADLNRHHRTHTRPFKCPICQKSFTESDRLERHNQLVHIDERPWECDYCKKKFRAKFNLQRHIVAHHTLHLGVGFSCKYCEKEFARKDSLNLHHLTHRGERPFECTICRKTFASSQSLKRHARVHSET